jgi:hypothetical protein
MCLDAIARIRAAALRGDELQTSLQRLVQLGPLTLEETGWVDTFGLCLRDESVRDLGTRAGLTSAEAVDHPEHGLIGLHVMHLKLR